MPQKAYEGWVQGVIESDDRVLTAAPSAWHGNTANLTGPMIRSSFSRGGMPNSTAVRQTWQRMGADGRASFRGFSNLYLTDTRGMRFLIVKNSQCSHGRYKSGFKARGDHYEPCNTDFFCPGRHDPYRGETQRRKKYFEACR